MARPRFPAAASPVIIRGHLVLVSIARNGPLVAILPGFPGAWREGQLRHSDDPFTSSEH